MFKLMLYGVMFFTLTSCSHTTSYSETIKHESVGYDTIRLGKEFFEERCVVCHGSDGKLGLSGAKLLPDTKLSLQEIESQVREGKKIMPAFRQIFTDEQITAIAKYVLTLKDTTRIKD